MLVFTHTITPRLQYITEFLGKQLTGKAFQLTTELDDYLNFSGPRINYSDRATENDPFHLFPHSLLFEENICPQADECFESNGCKAFFKTGGAYPFDIFAASFYLLSRYEEYLPHTQDLYGRFAHENSLAYREGFLDQPLINTWIEHFKQHLLQLFPSMQMHTSSFRFLPTYDIDEAYSYKHKDWWRRTGASIKDLFRGGMEKLRLRKKVLKDMAPDPFDSYDWIDELNSTQQLEPRYFFLVSEKTGKYDRNILPRESAMKELIRRHAEKYEIGVHPSWQSGDDPVLIKKELATIERITRKKICCSRQHFIRFQLPETFRNLSAAGVKEDYSMGYGSINGFRASVATPFPWFDLERNECSLLMLFPFCYMDANSFYEQQLTPMQALEEMTHYYQQVKKVNGMFSCIWHNTFLGTDEKFKGWREVYAQFVREINR